MRRLILAALGVSFLTQPVQAQVPAPTKEFVDAFAASNRSMLCAGGDVSISALLGELAKNFSINLFAMPRVPGAGDQSVEARAVHWILATAIMSQRDAAAQGVSEQQFQALDTIRVELVDALRWAQENPADQAIRITAPTPLTAPASATEANAIVASFFAPLTGQRAAQRFALACAPAMPAVPAPNQTASNTSRQDDPAPQVILAVRGKIDDLAVMRISPGSTEPGKAFEKASQASLAFTDNREKGESNVAIEATVGAGIQVTPRDSAFLFAQYLQTTTETNDLADDDDAKDIKAISFGLLARRSVIARGAFAGTLGLTIYPTFDLAQDARTARARLFITDIAIETGSQPLCDFERDMGPIRFNCRLGSFAELARVYRAGRSEDLKTLDDDNYLGVGGEVGVSVWLPALDGLAPLVLSTEYRYMAIVDGHLADPHRWTVALTYAVPKSNISIGFSRVDGSNFETFQRERLNKLTIGFKY